MEPDKMLKSPACYGMVAHFFAAMIVGQFAFAAAAEEPKSSSPAASKTAELPQVPAALIDPAFAGKIDLENIRQAIGELDAKGLTDQAEKLLLAERALKRKHKSLDFGALVELAIRMSVEQKDSEALAHLEKMLDRLSVHDFDAKVAAARPHAERTRKLAPGPNVPIKETTPEGIILYNSLCKQVKLAKVVGDRKALNSMRKQFEGLADLHPKQREHLLHLTDEAIASLPPELPVNAIVLRELSAPLYSK
jgi:hypothetical protein